MTTRRGQLSPGYFFMIIAVSVYTADGISKAVSHSCYADANDGDIMNLQVRILQNDDPMFEVYSFDAATGDTSLSTNRMSDPTCVKDTSGITDVYTTPIEYSITVTTTDSAHSCGIYVTTVSGVTFVKFLFRVYAYSSTILSVDDDSYMAQCRMDDLTGVSVSTGGVDASSAIIVILQEPQSGAYLRIRYRSDSSPVAIAKVGDEVFLSVEFFPELELGPDNYGSHFFIGFLGADPVSGTTSSTLFILVYPRYTIRTDVTVTTMYGSEKINITDGLPLKIIMPSELMGCAEGGVSETDDKGIEVESFDMEIGVMVCNEETATADCYTALPVDITSTEYYTTSMLAADEASELMIIAQEDGTVVDITVPRSSTHSIMHGSSIINAGETLTVKLNARETFHLAQNLSDPNYSHLNGYHITSNKSVSVISGNRNFASDHLAEQIPPINTFGTHHILIPVDLSQDSRLTTYLVQAILEGDTTVTRYLSSSTSEVTTITTDTYPPLMIDVASDAPCELVTDKPVMVTQVVNAPATIGFEPTMVMMPSVMQWSSEYIVYHPDYYVALLTVFKSVDHIEHYRVGGFPLAPTPIIDVNGPNGFVFGSKIDIDLMTAPYSIKLERTGVFATFMVLCYASETSVGVAVWPFGYSMADYNHCHAVGHRGDRLDNDCDGWIDEELFNGIDDDGDGVIDEDTIISISEYAGVVAIRPASCKVSGESTFPVGDTTVDITDASGCVITSSGGTDPFLPSSEFAAQSGSNIGTETKPKYLYSGYFDIAMFIDKPKLYFMCDISEQCSSSADTRCTTVCDGPGRKRRDDGSQVSNISSNIWVYPYDSSRTRSTVNEIYRDASVQSCMDNSNVQVIFGFMGVTTILSFFTATCFCCLFRRRNYRDKERERNLYHGRSTKRF